MEERSEFLLQILERFGLPLLSAVTEVSSSDKETETFDPKSEAGKIAELLGKSVQASIKLANVMELDDAEGSADSVRLALAAVSSKLIANQYKISQRVPGEKDLERMTSSLSATLVFADNFLPIAKNTARLETLDIDELLVDDHQVTAAFFIALMPAVNAIASYPFGMPETKLLQEVTGKMMNRAKEMRERLFEDNLSEGAAKQVELTLFKTLVSLYSECHKGETARLSAMSENEMAKVLREGSGTLSIDSVWKAFEKRCSMLETVSKNLLPNDKQTESGTDSNAPHKGKASIRPPVSATREQERNQTPFGKKQENVRQATGPIIFKKKQPEQPENIENAAIQANNKQENGTNPMSFFKIEETTG